MDINTKELIDKVIDTNYCIGCGICASIKGSPFTMELDEHGMYKPIYNNTDNNMDINPMTVCPFSNEIKNETEIAKKLYDTGNIKFDKYIGYYLNNYAGYVKKSNFREKGSSGGMGNWIASQLLKLNLVDGIIHVKQNEGSNKILFDYQVSHSFEELEEGAKSKYYPIELSQVLDIVKKNEGKYALIGVPCFIKGVRLLAEQDAIIKDRIKYCIGLVCGHLKSDRFAKSIGWQMGIEPKSLIEIDFRKKILGRGANDYGVEAKGIKGNEILSISKPTKELFSTNWGYGFFKYNACEFCDDVLAETADVTVGDAWLPEYTNDSMGTNIVIVRNPIIKKIIDDSKNEIHLEEISTSKIYQSQASGLRHRREGLSYRLYLKDKNKQYRPKKRVTPSNKLSSKRKKIYIKRNELTQESFKAFKLAEKQNDFTTFVNIMNPTIKDYKRVLRPSIFKRSINKVKRNVERMVKR